MDHCRPARFLTPPNLSSGRCLSAAPPARPLSLTPPPPASRMLHNSAYHLLQHSQWGARPLSTAFVGPSAADLSLSPVSPPAASKRPRSSSSASSSSSLSSRSYALWAGLLLFSLLLSLLFIVHLSAHAVPLSDARSPLSLPLSSPQSGSGSGGAGGAGGLIHVAPNSLHGPASSLQPQLLFSRSVAARQLESFADRKKRKEAIAVEEQVEADMRRMTKIGDNLRADWEAKQRAANAAAAREDDSKRLSQQKDDTPAASVEQAVTKKTAALQPPALPLRGGAATKSRDEVSAAPH